MDLATTNLVNEGPTQTLSSSMQGTQHRLSQGAVSDYQSCIRTSLLLAGGYEVQESLGLFMLAFHDGRAAVEWAISAQLCLLRCAHGNSAKYSLLDRGIITLPLPQYGSRF